MTVVDLQQRLQAQLQKGEAQAHLAQLIHELIEPDSPDVISVSAIMADLGKLKAAAVIMGMSVADVAGALQYAVWLRKTIVDEGTVRESFKRLSALLAQADKQEEG